MTARTAAVDQVQAPRADPRGNMKNPPIHDYLLEQLIKVHEGSLNPELT